MNLWNLPPADRLYFWCVRRRMMLHTHTFTVSSFWYWILPLVWAKIAFLVGFAGWNDQNRVIFWRCCRWDDCKWCNGRDEQAFTWCSYLASVSRNPTSPLDENQGKMLSFWGEGRRNEDEEWILWNCHQLIDCTSTMAEKNKPSLDTIHCPNLLTSPLPTLEGKNGRFEEFYQLKRSHWRVLQVVLPFDRL